MTRSSIILKKAFFITRLPIDGWAKLLLDVLVLFLIHGSVLSRILRDPTPFPGGMTQDW